VDGFPGLAQLESGVDEVDEALGVGEIAVEDGDFLAAL